MAIREHDYHISFDDKAILWRYMSIEKYESLLKEQALFFCRADKFSDPFEGSVPKKEAKYRRDQAEAFAQMKGVPYIGSPHENSVNGLSSLHRKLKSATTVNCWSINDNESDAMWHMYLKNNEGVAIQSSKVQIYKAFQNTSEDIGMSKIRYIDYVNGIWHHPKDFPHEGYNLITPLIHKRLEFEHEKELRLYRQIREAENDPEYWQKQKSDMGELLNVDVKSLVEKIIFAPTADNKVRDKIMNLTARYGCNFEFKQSTLSEDPQY